MTVCYLSLIKDPPHLDSSPLLVDLRCKMAAQGNSFFSANPPPRIVLWDIYYQTLFFLIFSFVSFTWVINFFCPQRQSASLGNILYKTLTLSKWMRLKHKMLPSIFSESQGQGNEEAVTNDLAWSQGHCTVVQWTLVIWKFK